MENFPMCRICLVKNVPMYALVNKNLHELYEKLTDIAFVTEDSRPILVCFFCCAKLKQCFKLLKKCLEAEELFAQMMDENYKPKLSANHDHIESFSGFIKTPIEIISIVDKTEKDTSAIKEELSVVCEDIIEHKEENQSDGLEPENIDNSRLDVEYILPHHSESHSEGDVPLMRFKMELDKELEVPKNKRRAVETSNLEPENIYNSHLDVEDIPPPHSGSDSEGDVPLMTFKTEIEEELEVSKNKRRAVESSNVNYIGSFSRRFIFELWLSTRGSDTERCRQVIRQLMDMMPDADNVDVSNLEKVVKSICKRLVAFWKSSTRKKRTVLKKHSKWLSHNERVSLPRTLIIIENTFLDIPDQTSSSGTAAAVGRPKKEFRDLQ